MVYMNETNSTLTHDRSAFTATMKRADQLNLGDVFVDTNLVTEEPRLAMVTGLGLISDDVEIESFRLDDRQTVETLASVGTRFLVVSQNENLK